jgi:hypothetical protein
MFKNLMEGGNRKQTTIDSYERRLKTLNNGEELDNLSFLYDYDVILEKIQKYKITTQRNFIIAIVSVLKNVKTMKSMYDKYSKLLEQYNTELKTNNVKSESQKENWISQDEVIKVYDELYNQMKKDNDPELCNALMDVIKNHWVRLQTHLMRHHIPWLVRWASVAQPDSPYPTGNKIPSYHNHT